MEKIIFIPLLLFLLFVPIVFAGTAAVNGVVLDRLDNLVSFAEIKFECLNQVISADKFGSFSIKDVPVGECRVFAAYKDAAAFETIDVLPNQTLFVELKLDKTIINLPPKNNFIGWTALPIALFILLCLFLFVVFFFKFRKKGTPTSRIEAKESRSSKLRDVLKVLRPNEKAVVEFLLQNNHESSQNNIRYGTGISRTSLARCLRDLEAKNIVSIARLGKLVKVKLADWLLEK